ncbi:MAG: hypothetical protein ACJA2K_001627 [Thalassolituus sp.]|jgi:hypothetical protein
MKSPLGLEARLPIFDLFKDAVFLLWAKRGRLVSMFLPIIVVLMVLDHYSSALGESVMATVGEVAGETKDMPEGMGRFLVLTLVSMLLSVLMATTVHRFSLQDSAFWPKNALRFPIRSDWRYLARSVQILAICVLILMGVSVVGGAFAGILSGAAGPEAIQQTIILFMVPGFMIMLYVSARLSVTLPEIAIGTEGSDLSRAWRMSKGNGSRLLIVVLLLPFIVTSPFLMLYSFDHIMMNIIAAFGIYAMTLISVTVLSLSYQFLLEFYEPQDGESVQPETSASDDSLDA